MAVIAIVIFLVIPILIIGIGYYIDYKRNKTYFLLGIKGLIRGLAIFVIGILVTSLFWWSNDRIFPLDRDFGVAKNKIRAELGIPLIENNWVEQPSWGNQYRQWYVTTSTDSAFKHVKKRIEFNIWGATSEEDYFESPNSPIKLIIRYDYQSNSSTYYKLEPIPFYEQQITDAEGKIILNRKTEREIELTKKEFDKILKEYTN